MAMKLSTNKLLILVCIVSVALNVLLLGYVLGGKAGIKKQDRKYSKFERKVERLVKDLPPPVQEQFMNTMREYTPDLEENLYSKLREQKYRLAEAVGGEEMNVREARQIFSDIRNSFDEAHMRFQEGLLKAIQELSPEHRKKVAEALEKRRKPRR